MGLIQTDSGWQSIKPVFLQGIQVCFANKISFIQDHPNQRQLSCPYLFFSYLFLIYLFIYLFIYFLLEFYLPTYSIIPSAHPIKCPPQCPSPSYPILPPTSPSTTPCFPELGVSHVLSPSLIFPTHFLSFPLYSLSLFFIFPK